MNINYKKNLQDHSLFIILKLIIGLFIFNFTKTKCIFPKINRFEKIIKLILFFFDNLS
jgi:hypothetical protein